MNLPSSVTSIGDFAFEDCTKLTTMTIPSSVISIGDKAFNYCTSLHEATFIGNAPTLGQQAFDKVAEDFTVVLKKGATGFTTPKWHGYPAKS